MRSQHAPNPLVRLLQRVVDVREDEVRVLLLSCAYFFLILASYYIIRPLRDEMGVAGGVRNIPWLFTGTLVGMLIFHPPFAALVARLPRQRFISITYRFFMANLLIFFVLLKLTPESQSVWAGRAFFIWTSVFNLFVVSVFWSFMADVYRLGQGKRLFGFIGVGGTIGAIVGSAITVGLAERLGPINLLIASIVLLELGVRCVNGLSAYFSDSAKPHSPAPAGGATVPLEEEALRQREKTTAASSETPIGGAVLAGITSVMRSPYLLGIVGYMLLYTVAATFLYIQQADVIEQAFSDRAQRTVVFAKIDLAVNVLTVLTQVFLTGRIIKLLGVGVTLTLLPAVCIVGFTNLGLMPTLGVLVVFQVLRRASNYAVARPTRETLYTVVPREDKYKAKNFIDTFVYRGGDQIGAWSYALMQWLGLGLAAIAFVAVPICGLWLLIGLWLGREQSAKAETGEEAGAASATPAPAAT